MRQVPVEREGEDEVGEGEDGAAEEMVDKIRSGWVGKPRSVESKASECMVYWLSR